MCFAHKNLFSLNKPPFLWINKIFCIYWHFSYKQCSTSSLSFDSDQLEVWKNITFKERETRATAAMFDDTSRWPIFLRLKLKKEVKTICPENFLITAYTKVSEFFLDLKHWRLHSFCKMRGCIVAKGKAKHSVLFCSDFKNLFFLNLHS